MTVSTTVITNSSSNIIPFTTKLRYVVYIGTGISIFTSAAYLAYHTKRMELQQFDERLLCNNSKNKNNTNDTMEQQAEEHHHHHHHLQHLHPHGNKASAVSTTSTSVIPVDGTNNTTTSTLATNTTTTTTSTTKKFSFVHNPLRNEQYSKVATCYDELIGRDEFYMGIDLIRRLVLYWYAKGTILEVGAGTGRNIPYYIYPYVKRIVLVDTCYEMLEQARDKVMLRQSKKKNKQKNQPQYVFVQGDSSHLHQLPNHAFDTVIDTFGLCSYNDPIAVIHEMIRKCKKDGTGTLIFIEHGRSKTWNMITQHLDKHAEQHAANWGCVWNRDLDAILEQVTIKSTKTQTTTTTTAINRTDNNVAVTQELTNDAITIVPSTTNNNKNTTNTNNHLNNMTATNTASSSSSPKMEIIHLQTFHFGTTYVIVARPAVTAANEE